MNKIDELIKEKCPNGVEYKTLEQLEDSGVITLGRGKVISKKDIQDNPGEYPIYSSSAVGSGLLGTYGDYMFEDVRLSWSIDGGGKFFYRDAPKYSVTNVCGWLTVNKPEIMDIKYLYFALTNEWSKKVFDYVHKAHPSVIRKEYTIPVPPLEIQQEIVRMLNSFTELEAELEAELAKRKQQYEHYRDLLLSFENIAGEGGQVEWFALGDIATVTKLAGFEFTKYVTYSNSGNVIALRGLNVKNGQLDLKDVKYIDKSDLSKLNRSKLVIGDMLFTYVGTVGQVALISENEKYYLAPNVSMIRLNDKNAIMPKYLMYYFQTNTFRSSQIDRLLQTSSMQNIPMEKIRKFNIPVPSKKIQERIVYVLDNFDSVCNDLKIGLPAEIEARQKQYEYYRDRLLSFDAAVGGGTERERGVAKLLQYIFGYARVRLNDVILSLNTGLNPRSFFRLNTDDATNYYITIREIHDGNIIPTDKTDRMNDEALRLCNNRSNLEAGDVLFSGTGTIGETAVITATPKDWNIKEGVYTIKPDQEFIIPMFLRYALMSKDIIKEYEKKIVGGTVKSIPMKELKNISIYIPTLEKQQEIIDLVDRFNTLCNDIKSGLPAEIEARHKQYEYYRDKLLTFSEK